MKNSSQPLSSQSAPAEIPVRKRFAKLVVATLSSGVLLLSVPILTALFFRPVEFNQFLIQKLRITYGVATAEDWRDTLTSLYGHGLQQLLGPKTGKPKFDDERSVFRYVFSQLPPYAVVYPTEGFYYWTTKIDGVGEVSGNIRMADLDAKKQVSFAYFTIGSNPVGEQPDRVTHFHDFTAGDGLEVRKVSEREYDLSYDGRTVRLKGPKQFVEPYFSLLPTEEVVGRIHDEAGIRLFLLFNHETKSFYEVLDEKGGLTERLASIDEHHSIGRRTGFVYFNDPEWQRKLLVGVDLQNIKANNFLDGPGDQVPYWVDFLDKINVAYPNTMLGDGTDRHGVYLNKPEWVRIAVSPYFRYDRSERVTERFSSCSAQPEALNPENRPKLWTCLTKEWWNSPPWRLGILDQLVKEGKQLPPWLNDEHQRLAKDLQIDPMGVYPAALEGADQTAGADSTGENYEDIVRRAERIRQAAQVARREDTRS